MALEEAECVCEDEEGEQEAEEAEAMDAIAAGAVAAGAADAEQFAPMVIEEMRENIAEYDEQYVADQVAIENGDAARDMIEPPPAARRPSTILCSVSLCTRLRKLRRSSISMRRRVEKSYGLSIFTSRPK
jgi:hypothetical protein